MIRDPSEIVIVLNDGAKGVKSGSNESRGSSMVSAQQQAPVPWVVKLEQELLRLTIEGNLEEVKELVSKAGLQEVTGVRGYSHFIDDYLFENEPVEVQMWNPVHFAVYHGHLPLVKFFFQDLQVHVALAFARPHFESEQAEISDQLFQDDNIFLLRLAYDRAHLHLLHFFLNHLHGWLPNAAFRKLLDNSKLFLDALQNWDASEGERPEPCSPLLEILLSSKVAH